MPDVPTAAEIAARLGELARRDIADAGAIAQIRAICDEACRLYNTGNDDGYYRVAFDAASEIHRRRIHAPGVAQCHPGGPIPDPER
jgi:hypothetical protein